MLITIGNNTIENASQFTYLGLVFDNQSLISFTEYFIARSSAKFNQLREVLCDAKVIKKTRWKFMEACVVPRPLYGLHKCCPKEAQVKKIGSSWFQFLRSMVKRGWSRMSEDPDDPNFRLVYTNLNFQHILGAKSIRGSSNPITLDTLGMCAGKNIYLSLRRWCSLSLKSATIQTHRRRLLMPTAENDTTSVEVERIHQETDEFSSRTMKLVKEDISSTCKF